MKLLISIAAAAVFTAGSSFAQTQPETPVPPPPALTAPGETVTPPEADAERDQTRMERRAERRERAMRWHREMRDDDRRWRRQGRHGRNNADQGARFQIEVDEDGSIRFDARCAADEPMQTCADVMLQIFNRLEPSVSPSDDATPPPAQQ